MRLGLLNRRSGKSHSALILFVGLLAASVAVIGLYLAGLDAIAALTDGSLRDQPEAGLISDFGIFLMSAASIAAATAAWRKHDLALAALALFCLVFAVDDAFLIHEALGRWEVAFFAMYALLALLVFLQLSKSIGRLSWPVFLAFAAFAVSVCVDLLWGPSVRLLGLPSGAERFVYRLGYVLEDVPKFAGILILTSCAIGEALLITPDRK